MGGERKGDVHFLHSVGFKICFLKFILNIAGSRKNPLALAWSHGIASAGLSHQLGWMLQPSSFLWWYKDPAVTKPNAPSPTTVLQKLPHLPRPFKKKSEIILISSSPFSLCLFSVNSQLSSTIISHQGELISTWSPAPSGHQQS